LDSRKFSDISDANKLATELTQILSKHDRHFNVGYVAGQSQRPARMRRQVNADDADPWAADRRGNFGFSEVKVLAGNVGYIKLDQFAYLEPALETATAALKFVANTDAVIFDLRDNHGGTPSMVQFLISHFLNSGGDTLINTFLSRDREFPREMWSLPTHPVGNRPAVPLYVLTSGGTGSAAEGFAYHLRAMERATLVDKCLVLC